MTMPKLKPATHEDREAAEVERLRQVLRGLRRHISCSIEGDRIFLIYPEATLRYIEKLERGDV